MAWSSGNIDSHIDEAISRWTWLVPAWVNVRGYTVLKSNQANPTHFNSAWPSLRA